MLCTACRRQVQCSLQPPDVPAAFWDSDQLRDALAAWHMGRVVHAYRHHPFHGRRPLPQEQVAGWLGITQAQLSRVETGPPVQDLDRLRRWARTLKIPADLLWFQLPEQSWHPGSQIERHDGPAALAPSSGRLLVAEWTPQSTAALLEQLDADDQTQIQTPAVAIRMAHEWLVHPPPQLVEVRAGRRIGERLVRKSEHRVEQLRHMDDFIGGGDLHELVERELRAAIQVANEATYTEALGRRLLVVVADLCQLAGWVVTDAGMTGAAERYYTAGIQAAHAANDPALAANLISLLSYLYANTGRRDDAVLLAHTAWQGAKRQASATTQALLHERIAWAHARAGELRHTQRALDEADRFYARRNPADDPGWVYWLNHEEMQIMAGRCYTELRQPLRAEPLLRAALDRYSDDLAREVSLYASWLADSYVQAGEIDEAAAQASRSLLLSTRVNSSRARERRRLLWARLRPHRQAKAVRQFEEQFRAIEDEENAQAT
jgi:tetratricopeptide (TPR) repeat protein